MSRVNFDILISKLPSAGESLDKIRSWVDRHPTIVYLTGQQVQKIAPELSPEEIAEIFRTLVAEHQATREYRLRTPGGYLIGHYRSAIGIPRDVTDDRTNETIDRDECDIVTGVLLENA